ncbi:hypothetical protein [uncultured Enterococcus sp.]|uniref:hypothetical protein n=1 Tax=uncultured Enterococcus sp. TaxID=167972 RepID=UPI002AA95F03|nr:hypothetical protein [uncultured Enterococcus sp.]
MTIIFSVVSTPIIVVMQAILYALLHKSEAVNGLLVSAIVALSLKYVVYFVLLWGGNIPSGRILLTFLVLEIPFSLVYWKITSSLFKKTLIKEDDE